MPDETNGRTPPMLGTVRCTRCGRSVPHDQAVMHFSRSAPETICDGCLTGLDMSRIEGQGGVR